MRFVAPETTIQLFFSISAVLIFKHLSSLNVSFPAMYESNLLLLFPLSSKTLLVLFFFTYMLYWF